MKKNMSGLDRTIRSLIAAVIAILYFTNVISGTVGYVLLAVAVIFLLTSLLSICPIYLGLGLSTRKKEE